MEIFNETIGICILNYHASNHVKELLKSLEKLKNYKTKVVIVDNSNDQIEFEKLSSIISKYENVKLIKSPKNLGYYKGNLIGLKYLNNLGIKYSFIVNPDIRVKDWDLIIYNLLNKFIKISKEYELFSIGPYVNNAADPSSPLLRINSLMEIIYNVLYPISYLIVRLIMKKKSKKEGFVFAVEGSFFLCDIKKYISIEQLFENVFLYREEKFFGEISKRNNWKNYYYPKVSVQHLHKPRNLKDLKNNSFYKKSTKEFYKKFYPDRKLLISIILYTYEYRIFIKKMIIKILAFFRK